MSPFVITLTTDFGLQDAYVGAMKGVLLSACPEAQIIDVCHEVAPQNVRAGALRLAAAAYYFPSGTVHIAVVDPGVGGPRRGLAIESEGQFFVGPDNGVLSLAAPPGRRGWRAVELTEPSIWRTRVSHTFHGRDVFAPAAARLANSRDLLSLGTEVSSIQQLAVSSRTIAGDRIVGAVLDIDRFGNLITNVRAPELHGQQGVSVEVAGTRIDGLSTWYDPSCPVVALINSEGWLEVACPGASAAERLGVGLDAPVWVALYPGRAGVRGAHPPAPF